MNLHKSAVAFSLSRTVHSLGSNPESKVTQDREICPDQDI
jgi:hypothetical protein